LTRLAVRNIPRTVEEHEFKALAIQAVTEFDEEVTKELRIGLTEEELARDETGGRKGRLVRQAKIVLEKAGRSKGYGFIEYNTHANALKGLRWLNARVLGVRKVEAEGDRKRRLLVEFAIENAQVVKRRKDREEASRRKAATTKEASKEKRKEKRRLRGMLLRRTRRRQAQKGRGWVETKERVVKRPRLRRVGTLRLGPRRWGRLLLPKGFARNLNVVKRERISV
jgi:nucleolar protein 4